LAQFKLLLVRFYGNQLHAVGPTEIVGVLPRFLSI
jgi:hypothetical protein